MHHGEAAFTASFEMIIEPWVPSFFSENLHKRVRMGIVATSIKEGRVLNTELPR
jgi:hypothetical protein